MNRDFEKVSYNNSDNEGNIIGSIYNYGDDMPNKDNYSKKITR